MMLPAGFVREADSILSLYMREVGEVPLITPKQEIELAARIKKGDDAAREHMIRANLRFVIKIARDYENLGLPASRSDQRRQHRSHESRGKIRSQEGWQTFHLRRTLDQTTDSPRSCESGQDDPATGPHREQHLSANAG